MATTERPAPWYRGITGYQWLVLVIASAGWVFDVYEGQLWTIFKTPALSDVLHFTTTQLKDDPQARAAIDWHGNFAMACFLVGGAIGGLGFGVLGDRYGRVRVMSLTILLYSMFSALTAFATSAWQIHSLRLFVALGTGGEWAIAAALVAETFPPRGRPFASGIFHASSVLGGALASWTGMILVGQGAWRWGFLVGLAPALLILWIRMSLREPPEWFEARAKAATPSGQALGSVRELLSHPVWSRRAWIGLGLAAIGLGTYWGIFAWGPELMRDVLRNATEARKQSASSFAYLLMNFTGGLLGLLGFAPLAARFGRRGAFGFYHIGALVLAPTTFLLARTELQTLLLLPVMAFFVVGMHAGYAIYFPELFPTRLRATGASFCFNVGRLLGAVILIVRGELGAAIGLRWAVVVLSSLFLVGLALLVFAPETRGEPLPE